MTRDDRRRCRPRTHQRHPYRQLLRHTPQPAWPSRSGYIDIYQIDGGLITEAWHLEDIAGLMREISP
jgi:hypothetical protein